MPRKILRQLLHTSRRLYPVDVIYRAALDFSRQQGSVYASSISFYSLLSLFPFLILLVTIFGWLLSDPDLQERVIGVIVEQFPPGADLSDAITQVVERSDTSRGVLGAASLLGTTWTASGMFNVLRRSLNNAFSVTAGRSFLRGRLFDILSVFAVIVLAMLSVAATTALSLLRRFSTDLFSGDLVQFGWTAVTLLLPFVFSFLAFLIVYSFIPNHRLRPRDLWVGAVVAAIGFEVAKNGFAIYLTYFDRYDEIYGTLGGVVAFLFFVFLVANITIFGAALAAEITRDRQLSGEPAPAEAVEAN